MSVTHNAKVVAKRAVGSAILRTALLRAAAVRRHALVLLYHRICPEDDTPPSQVVPSVGERLFRLHLEVLSELGQIAPLERLLEPPEDPTLPRFALTFDDDYRSHLELALPLLMAHGLPATFFLSGRSLHGLGPYWFENLEQLILEHGVGATARRLGTACANEDELAERCVTDPSLRQRLATWADFAPTHLTLAQIAKLAAVGMTVGFHTLHHSVLTELDDEARQEALSLGRSQLETVVGRPVTLLAYPHGRADPRVAQAARDAGYLAAWTGRPRPVRPDSDRFLLGRWEPGSLSADELRAAVVLRLHRATPVRGHAPTTSSTQA